MKVGKIKPFAYTEAEKKAIIKEYCKFSSHTSKKLFCSISEEWKIKDLLAEKKGYIYSKFKKS
jgi:hypothetical protein